MSKQKTHTIIEAFVDFNLRMGGFVVAVRTGKLRMLHLSDATDDLESAQVAVDSINQGRWVGTRKSKGCTFTVDGSKLTATWNTK